MREPYLPIRHRAWIAYPRRMMRRNFILAASTALLCGTTSAAHAADLFVHPTAGVDAGNNCEDSDNPCKTIQVTVTGKAAPNDTIVLMVDSAGGTTTFPMRNGVTIDQDLVFRGEGADPQDIVLDATGSNDRHFAIQNGASVQFTNLTLVGGQSFTDGGSIDLVGGGTLTIDNVVFENNVALDSGGAIALDGALIASDTEFHSNHADPQGGGSGGGVYLRSGSAEITDVHFIGNSAPNNGGGLAAVSGTVELRSVEMMMNEAEFGGAVSCLTNLAANSGCESLRITDESKFTGNFADRKGGAIFTNATSVIEDTDFSRNKTDKDSVNAEGGAIFANILVADDADSLLLVRNSGLRRNRSGGNGGAIASSSSNLQIDSSTFWRNTAGASGHGSGGGLSFEDVSGQGGLNLENSTFGQNRAASSAGAINIVGGSQHDLFSLTLVDNVTPAACVGCAQDISHPSTNMTMSRVLIDHPNLGGSLPECNAVITSGENNLIPGVSCGDGANFRVAGSAGILTFAKHPPGRTHTYRITTSSAANQTGGGTEGTATQPPQPCIPEDDQRGSTRLIPCDIGAFERP